MAMERRLEALRIPHYESLKGIRLTAFCYLFVYLFPRSLDMPFFWLPSSFFLGGGLRVLDRVLFECSMYKSYHICLNIFVPRKDMSSFETGRDQFVPPC